MTTIIITAVIAYILGFVACHFSTRSLWRNHLRNQLERIRQLPAISLDTQGSVDRAMDIYKFIMQKHKEKHVETNEDDSMDVRANMCVIASLVSLAHDAGCKIEVRDTGRNEDLEQVEDF